MTSTRWSPQVTRAMHEHSNAAPAAPAVMAIRQRQPPPARQPRMAVSVVAAAAILATAVGVTAVVRRDHPAPMSGPPPTVDVHHVRIEVTLDAQLECETQIDSAGTFATMVIDSYSDRPGRRWRTQVTYPDGSTVDSISQGSAVYPTGRFQRGDYRGSTFGCFGPDGERFALVSAPGEGSFYTLDLSDELAPDERPFVMDFHDFSTLVEGDHVDSQGRLSELWEQLIEGTAGYGNVETFDVLQISRWFVDQTDGRTVTERRYSNTVSELGSATETSTLVINEAITVPTSFFDTTGYHELETYPRPSLNGSPTDETIVSDDPKLIVTAEAHRGSMQNLASNRLRQGSY